MTGGIACYVRIRQQPTALQETADPRLAAFESDLTVPGFAVQRVADMDGWLAYHAAFVACAAQPAAQGGCRPLLGTDHALADGRAVLRRARAACRAGDAGPGPPGRVTRITGSPALAELLGPSAGHPAS
jgi:hypothetical protein